MPGVSLQVDQLRAQLRQTRRAHAALDLEPPDLLACAKGNVDLCSVLRPYLEKVLGFFVLDQVRRCAALRASHSKRRSAARRSPGGSRVHDASWEHAPLDPQPLPATLYRPLATPWTGLCVKLGTQDRCVLPHRIESALLKCVRVALACRCHLLHLACLLACP